MNDESMIEMLYTIIECMETEDCMTYIYNNYKDNDVFYINDKEKGYNMKIIRRDDYIQLEDYNHSYVYVIKIETIQEDAQIYNIAIQNGEKLFYYKVLDVLDNYVFLEFSYEDEGNKLECVNTIFDRNNKEETFQIVQQIIEDIQKEEQEENDTLPVLDENKDEIFHTVFEEFISDEYSYNIHLKRWLFDMDDTLEKYDDFEIFYNGKSITGEKGKLIAYSCDLSGESRLEDAYFKKSTIKLLIDSIKEKNKNLTIKKEEDKER